MRIKKPLGLFLIVVSVLGYIAFTAFFLFSGANLGNPVIRGIWIFSFGLTLIGMIVYVFHRPSQTLPLPEGRVVCVVPTYNEDPKCLESCLDALLKQSCPPDLIYVVDDGSVVPVKVPTHPTIHLIRLAHNSGKRAAQAAALRGLDTNYYPFLLSVDSDSILAPNAVEALLRQMSDPEVKACTGVVLASNYSKKLLAKIQDFNYGVNLILSRSFGRVFSGALNTTSGACAVYRSEIVCFHLDDYLEHGKRFSGGDDRRLSIYAMMEGKVLFVPEAVVYTVVPETMRLLWRQRSRWAMGAWLAIPWVFFNLPLKRAIYTVQDYVLSILYPLLIITMLLYSLSFNSTLILEYLAFWLITTYLHTLFYLASYTEDPQMYWRMTKKSNARKKKPSRGVIVLRRFIDWLYITPLLILFVQLFTPPCKYLALVKALRRKNVWGTR